ncbi:MAG: hypothetical protein Athens101410_500 [Parcubacteria group bacterium Athens1014_10]|nr:MAG: hypothetical protein Athens101410_500 [Parcubacteria group bacterium Athens1014_10]TSD04896.1 MAG: hypothetical protein Athens071412_577 [Parcubacteria group bacterium Athens0714_12]
MNEQFKRENIPSQKNIEDKKFDFQKLDEEISCLKDEIDELEIKAEDENLSEEERKKIHEEIIKKRDRRLALTNKAIEEVEKERNKEKDDEE